MNIFHLADLLACTCGDIQPGRVEPASPRHGDASWEGGTPRSPVPVTLHLLALHHKPSLFGFLSAIASALNTYRHGVNPGDARNRSLIGRSVMTTPPFILQFFLCK